MPFSPKNLDFWEISNAFSQAISGPNQLRFGMEYFFGPIFTNPFEVFELVKKSVSRPTLMYMPDLVQLPHHVSF